MKNILMEILIIILIFVVAIPNSNAQNSIDLLETRKMIIEARDKKRPRFSPSEIFVASLLLYHYLKPICFPASAATAPAHTRTRSARRTGHDWKFKYGESAIW